MFSGGAARALLLLRFFASNSARATRLRPAVAAQKAIPAVAPEERTELDTGGADEAVPGPDVTVDVTVGTLVVTMGEGSWRPYGCGGRDGGKQRDRTEREERSSVAVACSVDPTAVLSTVAILQCATLLSALYRLMSILVAPMCGGSLPLRQKVGHAGLPQAWPVQEPWL